MEPIPDTPPLGAFSALLTDQDLAHLERALRQSLPLDSDSASAALPPAYWRARLAAVARQSHLSHTQLQTMHRLYLCIERFEAAARAREAQRTAHEQNQELAPTPELSVDA